MYFGKIALLFLLFAGFMDNTWCMEESLEPKSKKQKLNIGEPSEADKKLAGFVALAGYNDFGEIGKKIKSVKERSYSSLSIEMDLFHRSIKESVRDKLPAIILFLGSTINQHLHSYPLALKAANPVYIDSIEQFTSPEIINRLKKSEVGRNALIIKDLKNVYNQFKQRQGNLNNIEDSFAQRLKELMNTNCYVLICSCAEPIADLPEVIRSQLLSSFLIMHKPAFIQNEEYWKALYQSTYCLPGDDAQKFINEMVRYRLLKYLLAALEWRKQSNYQEWIPDFLATVRNLKLIDSQEEQQDSLSTKCNLCQENSSACVSAACCSTPHDTKLICDICSDKWLKGEKKDTCPFCRTPVKLVTKYVTNIEKKE